MTSPSARGRWCSAHWCETTPSSATRARWSAANCAKARSSPTDSSTPMTRSSDGWSGSEAPPAPPPPAGGGWLYPSPKQAASRQHRARCANGAFASPSSPTSDPRATQRCAGGRDGSCTGRRFPVPAIMSWSSAPVREQQARGPAAPLVHGSPSMRLPERRRLGDSRRTAGPSCCSRAPSCGSVSRRSVRTVASVSRPRGSPSVKARRTAFPSRNRMPAPGTTDPGAISGHS